MLLFNVLACNFSRFYFHRKKCKKNKIKNPLFHWNGPHSPWCLHFREMSPLITSYNDPFSDYHHIQKSVSSFQKTPSCKHGQTQLLPKCNALNSIGDIWWGPHIIRQNGRCFSCGIDLWRCVITDEKIFNWDILRSHSWAKRFKSWFCLNSLSLIFFSEQVMIMIFRKLGARCSHVQSKIVSRYTVWEKLASLLSRKGLLYCRTLREV